MKIIESYYGRIHRHVLNEKLPWNTIKNLVKEMFGNGVVIGTEIGFYGGNGYCLFDYFVTQESTHRWFSLGILASNLICVLIIGTCYILVFYFARKSSSAVSSESNPAPCKNNQKLQRKITIIISTDVLTWLPFTMVCFINYSEIVDIAHWYSVFCIFFLPINCIINPIGIYDETIFKALLNFVNKIKSILEHCRSCVVTLFVVGEQEEDIEVNELTADVNSGDIEPSTANNTSQ